MFFDFYKNTFFISLRHPFNKRKRETLRENYKEWRKQKTIKQFQKTAPEVIRYFMQAIESFPKPVKIWLEFGTLLGAYREKSIIAHDADIDLGINEEDMSDKLLAHLHKHGFVLSRGFVMESNNPSFDQFSAEYTVNYRGKVSLDLFVFKTLNNKKVCFCFDKEPGLSYEETFRKYNGRHRSIQIILNDFSLTESSFLGTKVYIPDNTPAHLAEVYGEDFMTPRVYDYENRIKDFELLLDNNTLGRELKYKKGKDINNTN